MAKKKKKKAEKTKDSEKSFLEGMKVKLLGGLSVFLIGLLTYLLTPLKDIVYHSIYTENPKIELAQNTNGIHVDEEFSLSLRVAPRSNINISGGTAELSYDETLLRFENENRKFSFEEIKSARYLLNGLDKFTPVKEGTTFIKAILETKYGTYKDSIEIDILAKRQPPTPNKDDFSGVWSIKIGLYQGEMNLHQTDKTQFTGRYWLDNDDVGTVSGTKDGSGFGAVFISENQITKWGVTSGFEKIDVYIEIKGNSKKYRIQNSQWKEVEDMNSSFFATTVIGSQKHRIE